MILERVATLIFRKKMLPIETMVELEQWIEDLPPDINRSLGDKDLPEKLGLKVEYVDHRKLPEDTEAELRPTDVPGYHGLIRINNNFKHTLFPYMHEIIHYLKDVGIGNNVTQVFTRKSTGKTKTEDEQRVNYLTASAVMRYRDIKKALDKYDAEWPKVDELVFVDSLCKKYQQDRVAVMRRIREVRRLHRYRSR